MPNTAQGDPIAAVERALVRIRRSQTRRALSRLAVRDGRPARLVQAGRVVDAVEEGPGGSGRELTVGVVAERLGIDQSRASRLVAEAVRAGLVARSASQGDGRRSVLELTAAGRDYAAAVHRSRQALVTRAMADWSQAERRELARLLDRFTEALSELTRG